MEKKRAVWKEMGQLSATHDRNKLALLRQDLWNIKLSGGKRKLTRVRAVRKRFKVWVNHMDFSSQ